MAITINWATKVIAVPKADMTLVQASPEIRSLDINAFRLALRDIEDGDGMPYAHTHNHVAPLSVGGVTLSRVVEIINGYTITFEDGQYAVNLTGANSNISDVTNVNQVSIRSANSAGLVQVTSGSGLSPAQDATLSSIKVTVEALPSAADIAAAVWDTQVSEFLTNGTVGKELADAMSMVSEIYQIQGLDPTAPMTVTTSNRVAGAISLAISGNGVSTTTVTRQ